MDIKTFGENEEEIEYILRPAVYCVIFNIQKDKIAIIQTSNGKFFLPGWGLENNETHEQCLKREALEEMGMDVTVGPFIGRARRYFYSTIELKYYLNDGFFYLCNTGRQIASPIEEDHFLKWMEPNQAKEILFHEHQSWAINEAIRCK
ncbi:NUDIX hydrolase [Lysinibacillus sp. NPDC093197]|uniref:NUDIX hydrolase n=1 Tax=Lysinibacillus sp. NPDC093197 TaxID=3364132 RepID=UPI003816CC16